MSGPDGDGDEMIVKCPKCREKVKISVAEAARTKKARCSKGHEFPLVQAM